MSFRWLKRYVPRGLHGRAALILVLPVVMLQLVVSVVFIQDHFEDVTAQMTRTLIRELRLVIGGAGESGGMEALAEPLGLDAELVAPDEVPAGSFIRWYDFSGRVMIRTLRGEFPDLGPVILPDNDRVTLYQPTGRGMLRVEFDRHRVTPSNPHQLFVNMLFFGALMTGVAYLYLRNQLRPITRLASAAEAFGRGRTVPYRPRGALEVRAAGNAFLDMRARIERQIEQRTLMLSGVSHDLRTPLTRMRLSLALLDEEDAAPLRHDIDEMQSMLDAFLEFAKGTAEGEPEPVDPLDLARTVVADARRAGQEVELVEASGEGLVPLRPGAIRRALENLIGNGVRHGSRVELSVVLSDRSLRFRVEDDGPGIPSDRRAEAVRAFTRLDPARNQDRGGGVGLGLAIATDIARAHGGVLRLGRSDRLGGLRADIVIAR